MKIKLIISSICVLVMVLSPAGTAAERNEVPLPLDIKKAEAEVQTRYAGAHPEIKEYILWTARSFGRSGMWLHEDAFAASAPDEREKKVQHLAGLLADGEYGRHLCGGLAEASAYKDKRLVPGLMKVAGYHR